MEASPNHRRIWTRDEDDRLGVSLCSGASLEILRTQHGRTAYAVVNRLQQLGLIVERGGWYYKVDPTPWLNWRDVRREQES